MTATDPSYFTVHVDVPASDASEASTLLFTLGTTGIEERDAYTLNPSQGVAGITLVAHFEDADRALLANESLNTRWSSRVVTIVGDAWRDGWKKFFRGQTIGTRFWVRPPWEEEEEHAGRLTITLDAGRAFGTGMHETTRLVMQCLESLVLDSPTVLDVGCGSGILGIAALRLGASRVVAIDVDAEAVAASQDNAARNGVGDRMRCSIDPVTEFTEMFDLVLANIRLPILVPMVDVIVNRCRLGGRLVLSGLLESDESDILSVYNADCGLHLLERRQQAKWLAFVFEKRA